MLFSLITPVYKGHLFLERLYASLLRQRANDSIEWVLVDDFSDDNNLTVELIQKLKAEAPFHVQTIFLKKNFFGAMSTFLATEVARGEYSIIIDQDDLLSDNAIELFKEAINKYQHFPDFAGVCGRCVDWKGHLIGTRVQWDSMLSNEFEIRHVYKMRGELLQCTKTSLLNIYFKDMRPGYTNGWAWSRMSLDYRFAYLNQIVRIYDTLNPNSTSNSKKIRHVESQFDQITLYLENCASYMAGKNIGKKFFDLNFLKLIIHWCRLGVHLKLNLKELHRLLPHPYHFLLSFAYGVGSLRNRIDKLDISL